jgi:protein-S-isoprenylcysteine O-methyltransferase Ste14
MTFLYAIGFVTGAWVPKHIDSGQAGSLATALAINLGLLGLFAVQHSGMARPGFKRWWTRLVPAPVERSTYVLVSSLLLLALFWFWRPMPQVLWEIEHPAARMAIYGVSMLGWLLVLTSTFLINHWELFGLRQVWRSGQPLEQALEQPFVIRALYRIVRHPMMLGFLIAFWAAPTMTVGHLLFAAATTGYIVVAVRFLEERDLLAQFGDTYRQYQRRVPMLLPIRRRSPTPVDANAKSGIAPGGLT